MSTPDNVRPLRPGQHQPGPDTAPQQNPARVTSWTADQLMATEFPAPKWAVPGLIPEGVTLLVGAPKVGKSWASLALGLTIAAGGKALGTIDVQAGPVLYLALEDTPRRLKSRMQQLLDGAPAPAGLTLATECPPLPNGGDTHITNWLERNPDARMVVIDVFAKMRGTPTPGASAYEADYTAVTRAKQLADRHGIAVVLVHHVRKQGADDFLSEVSGTNGIAGAADTVLVLKRARGQADGVLHITGRDVDETEKALSFDTNTGRWHLLDGPAHEHTMHTTRATILTHLRDNPGTTPREIAAATGITNDTAKQTCARMADAAQLHRDPSGRYSAPGTVTAVTQSPEPQ